MPNASVPVLKGASSVVKLPPLLRRKPWTPLAVLKNPTIWPESLMPNASVIVVAKGIVEGGEAAAAKEETVVGPALVVTEKADDLAGLVDPTCNGALDEPGIIE